MQVSNKYSNKCIMYEYLFFYNVIICLFPGTTGYRPNSNVKVDPKALALANKKTPSKLVGDLMLIVFSEKELQNGSVSGKKCNFKKSIEVPKKKLNEDKMRSTHS